MYKQVQFGLFGISENAQYNQQIRASIEGPLNNGWELNDWKVVERGVDNSNQPVVFIAVCLTREIDNAPVEPEEENA